MLTVPCPNLYLLSQGSLLGPLFYIIFINDMFDSIKVAKPFTYADDTKLLFVIHNSSEYIRLQEDLDELSQWNSLSDLSLNPTKCHHIIMYVTTLAIHLMLTSISSTIFLSQANFKLRILV